MNILLIDIDGTVSSDIPNEKSHLFSEASCYEESLEQVNKLYDEGHTIVYWTARGGNTGKDWTELTGMQLVAWGCKFHDVIMRQKPAFDLLIDDKSIRIEEL